MTDFSALKVTELKEELKSRGIPLTGLKLKQQFIDKLNEVESEHATNTENEQEKSPKSELATVTAEPEKSHDDQTIGTETQLESLGARARDGDQDGVTQSETEHHTTLAHDVPAESDGAGPDKEPEEAIQHVPAPLEPEEEHMKSAEDVHEIATQEAGQHDKITTRRTDTTSEDVDSRPLSPNVHATKETKRSASPRVSSDEARDNASSTPQPLASEISEDTRKRKRRSATPVPSTIDMALKKAKVNNGAPLLTKAESSALLEVQHATDEAQAMQTADGIGDEAGAPPPEPPAGADVTIKQIPSVEALSSPPAEPSRADEPEISVTPALHLATKALYMKNFKRPLHVPTLRRHVSEVARLQPHSSDDPVTSFYLDSVRTHAFVIFDSTPSASRARRAMHDVPFPKEPGRENLWIDFVPEEKVQEWIDIEAEGGRGPVRYEVVYEDVGDIVTARHREVGVGGQRSSAQRQSLPKAPPISTSVIGPGAVPGVHPERAALVPKPAVHSPRKDRAESTTQSSAGTGFKALDELFSFTTTKPKLYFKPVSDRISSERAGMLRQLRVTHTEMGRSGDEGMKRYRFESYKGHEEWVDKGPEFGYGKRGVGRLTGRGGAAYRGRGRGSDSWRGR